MGLKDLKSDLGKFRTVVVPDGKIPDPPRPVEFGEYLPVTSVADDYSNARTFTTPSILSFKRPTPGAIDDSDLTKLESNYDNDSISRYNLASRLEDENIEIKNKPETSGNNEESPITVSNVQTFGNNEESPINVTNVDVSGNNESSTIRILKPSLFGNNETSPITISKIEISGNNEKSSILPSRMNLETIHLNDNSNLNLDSIIRSVLSGRHEKDNSDLNIDSKILRYNTESRLIKLDSVANIDGIPPLTLAGGRYETYKRSNFNFLTTPSVDYFSNTFFTGFTQRQNETSYTGRTSTFSFSGGSQKAPSVDFFSNLNVSSGFHTFAKLGDSKFLFNSAFGNIGTVNFFSNVNVSDGFTLNMKLYDTKFLNNSQFGNIGFINAFADTYARGFTEKYDTTQFNSAALDYGLKGTIPSVDFFNNLNVTEGFHTFAKLGDSKYRIDSSGFTWKGGRNSAPSTNFFSDTYATGFTTFQNQSEYKIDSSLFVWKGGRANAPEVNYFPNINTTSGFTKFAFGQPTQFIVDSSNFTWKGGRTDAPAVDFFPNNNRDGFKTFNKLYESYYKVDSTSLHSVASTPSELARTGGITYKLGSQLIKSPLFNNVGFSSDANSKYTDVLKTREFNSILGETANKRNSPSLLDIQYEKLALSTDSFNLETITQPYIIRGIQEKGKVENERWNGLPIPAADGLIRGGASTALNRTLADVNRIRKFMLSTKGVAFITKQFGLHLAGQNQEYRLDDITIPGIPPTKIYNPLGQLLSVGGNAFGFHFTRTGLIPGIATSKYESAVKRNNENETSTYKTITAAPSIGYTGDQNRLLMLAKELLFPITDGYQLISPNWLTDAPLFNALQARGKERLAYKSYYDKVVINRLSYLTGPGSVYGIGSTIVNRTVNSIPKDFSMGIQLYSHKVHYAHALSHRHGNAVRPERFAADPLAPVNNILLANLEDNWYVESLIAARDNKLYLRKTTIPSALQNANPMWFSLKSPFSKKRNNVYNATVQPNDQNGMGDSDSGYAYLNQTVPPDGWGTGNTPIEQIWTYSTTDYLKLPEKGTQPNTVQEQKFVKNKIKDFRWVLGETSMNDEYPTQISRTQALRGIFTNPKIVDFEANNLVDRFGFGDHGKVGLYRDNPVATHRATIGADGSKVMNPRKFIGDRIQLIDFKGLKQATNTESPIQIYERDGSNRFGFDGTEDLIEFYITGPREKDRAIVFRATINDIQDNFSPSYNTIKYLGRADPIYLYSSFERSVSISFQIGITSRDELRSRWRSINALAAYTAPEYIAKSGRMRAPLMKITLGHLYRQTPVFINSLNYSFDNSQITWETAHLEHDGVRTEKSDSAQGLIDSIFNMDGQTDPGGAGALQLPKFINVKMDLKIIGNYRPQLNGGIDDYPDMGIMYNLYNTHNGRLPLKNEKVVVNYYSDTVYVKKEPPTSAAAPEQTVEQPTQVQPKNNEPQKVDPVVEKTEQKQEVKKEAKKVQTKVKTQKAKPKRSANSPAPAQKIEKFDLPRPRFDRDNTGVGGAYGNAGFGS